MDLTISPRAKALLDTLKKFINDEVVPAEVIYHEQYKAQSNPYVSPPIIEDLKKKAKALGLWNLFLPKTYQQGAGLTNLEYAYLAEAMGGYHLASEACNCSAPDTGNMEVLAKYGSPEQQEKWLKPLLNGDIRSVYFMTEPAVGSSDATNICTSIKREGDHYVINGEKWWSSGVMDTRCKVGILMGQTSNDGPKWKRQSMIIVPMDTPGIKIERHLTVFGYNDLPHGHGQVSFHNVRVPVTNMILGEGRGFEIGQGRLGPGRIHHCMRLIGLTERCLGLAVHRAQNRVTFGSPIIQHGTVVQWIADSRIELDQARLLVMTAAAMIDKVGAKGAKKEIAMIKIAVPNMAQRVIDRCIQIYGAKGVCQDTILPFAWVGARGLRIADGPDEVHRLTVVKEELVYQRNLSKL